MTDPTLIAIIGTLSSFLGTLLGAFIAYRIEIRPENLRKANKNKELKNKLDEGVSEFTRNTNLGKLPASQLEAPNRRVFSLIAGFIFVSVVLLSFLLLISGGGQSLVTYILAVPALWILCCTLLGSLFGVSIYKAISKN